MNTFVTRAIIVHGIMPWTCSSDERWSGSSNGCGQGKLLSRMLLLGTVRISSMVFYTWATHVQVEHPFVWWSSGLTLQSLSQFMAKTESCFLSQVSLRSSIAVSIHFKKKQHHTNTPIVRPRLPVVTRLLWLRKSRTGHTDSTHGSYLFWPRK